MLKQQEDGLLKMKNALISDLEDAKKRGCKEDIVFNAVHAAHAEAMIAENLIRRRQFEEACINLISQGSCLVDAGCPNAARATWMRARQVTRKEPIRKQIDELIESLSKP